MSDALVVFRVQDASGRGPWRPGLSSVWVDDDAPVERHAETVFDLATADDIRAASLVYRLGSACRSLDDLRLWFTPLECARLSALGFYPVQLRADVVIAESAWQMLIGRRRPFTDGATRRSWWAH